MVFMNEYISASDIEKYNINYINRKLRCGNDCQTIDRERDIYLGRIPSGREDEAKRAQFSVYCKGTLLEFDVWSEGGVFKGSCWAHYSVLRLSIPFSLEDK